MKRTLEKIFFENSQQFGRSQFYQSLPELGIIGQRSTKKRIRIYGLNNFLNKEYELLDIGCNCGFFSLSVSKLVKSVVGLEPNKELVKVANSAKKILKKRRCVFKNISFSEFHSEKEFDAILSLAVHSWVKMSFFSYIKKINELLRKEGKLIFESHELNIEDKDFNLKIGLIEILGFKIINKKFINEKKDMPRIVGIFIKKKNYSDINLLRKVNAFTLSIFVAIKIRINQTIYKSHNLLRRLVNILKRIEAN